MKKLITALAAAALVLPGAAYAEGNNGRDNHGQMVSKVAKQNHHFKKGDRFERSRAVHYRVLDYRDYRSLSAPPRGYSQWREISAEI